MGDQQARRSLVAAFAQELEDVLAGGRVERAGGLVGQHQAPLADQGPGDGGALGLAAGDLVGEAVGDLGVEAHLFERGEGGLAGLADAHAVEFERQGRVLGGGQARHQVVVLEDVADVAAAQRGQLLLGERRERRALDDDLARGGRVEAPGEVEQGGLAGAGGAHDGHQLSGLDGQLGVDEGVDGVLAVAVDTAHAPQVQDGHGGAYRFSSRGAEVSGSGS